MLTQEEKDSPNWDKAGVAAGKSSSLLKTKTKQKPKKTPVKTSGRENWGVDLSPLLQGLEMGLWVSERRGRLSGQEGREGRASALRMLSSLVWQLGRPWVGSCCFPLAEEKRSPAAGTGSLPDQPFVSHRNPLPERRPLAEVESLSLWPWNPGPDPCTYTFQLFLHLFKKF